MIRPARPQDLTAVATLYTQLTAEMAMLSPTVIRPLTSASVAYFQSYLQEDNARVLVAEVDHQVVGFALVVVATTGEAPEIIPHRFAFCIDLYVASDWRRQGHARALMAAAEAWGQAHDCEFLQLNVLAEDQPARAFYAQLGFSPQQLTLTKPLVDRHSAHT